MAGKGITATFKVKWTKKDKATYNVPAKTYEELYKFFEDRNKKKEEWAKFSVTTPKMSFKPPKGGPLTEVEMKIGYTTTMPVWSGYSKASKPVKDAWDAMYKALAKHEEIHRVLLLEQVAIFGKKISDTKDLDVKGLQKLLKAFSPDVDKAQKKFDDSSHHGQKDGVFLPAPDEFKDA